MANVKLTKVDLAKLRKKRKLYDAYLPTLQLKKKLLQAQVNLVEDEIYRLEKKYQKEKELVSNHARLLTSSVISDLEYALTIEKVHVRMGNIAGIEIPEFEAVQFHKRVYPLIDQPFWVDDAIDTFKGLIIAKQHILTAIQKKEILEKELRIISIRVNLFEKRLIPEIEKDISRIRIFLGDQELQSVAQAKVSKNRIERENAKDEEVYA